MKKSLKSISFSICLCMVFMIVLVPASAYTPPETYHLYDDFSSYAPNSQISNQPGWSNPGSVAFATVINFPTDSENQCLYLNDNHTSSYTRPLKKFTVQTEPTVFEFRVYVPAIGTGSNAVYIRNVTTDESTDYMSVLVFSSGKKIQLTYNSGLPFDICDYTVETWYNIKIVVYPNGGTGSKNDVYVTDDDGNLLGSVLQRTCRNSKSSVSNIAFGTSGSSTGFIYFDDVKVYPYNALKHQVNFSQSNLSAGEDITVDINLRNYYDDVTKNITAYVAFYNNNKELIFVEPYLMSVDFLDNETETFEGTVPENAIKAVVYLWDENMKAISQSYPLLPQ